MGAGTPSPHSETARVGRRGAALMLCFWLSWGVLALVAPAGATSVMDVVGGISQTSYTDYLDNSLYTHNGDTRQASNPRHNLARDNILSAFTGFGLTSSLLDFNLHGTIYQDVVGVLPGINRPNDYVILGAHYDSVACPGADDDASGVAAVMEAARVMSGYRFASTLVFVAFDQEETGLHGSYAYADAHQADNILGMLELDMIGFNPSGASHDRVALYGGTGEMYPSYYAEVGDAVTRYSGGLSPIYRGGIGLSDHQSFERFFRTNCLMIEDGWGSNPNYHSTADSVDTPGYLDYTYATQVTRAAVGLLAYKAGDAPEPATVALFAAGCLLLLAAARRRRLSG
jgi:hypothetical protein